MKLRKRDFVSFVGFFGREEHVCYDDNEHKSVIHISLVRFVLHRRLAVGVHDTIQVRDNYLVFGREEHVYLENNDVHEVDLF